MTLRKQKPNEDFIPIVLSADIGAYSMARSFAEEWSVRPVILTYKQILGPIANSRLFDVIVVKPNQITNPASEYPLIDYLLENVGEMKNRYPGKKLVICPEADSHVFGLAENHEVLARNYLFQVPSVELLDATNSKVAFAKIAEQNNIPCPTTIDFYLTDGLEHILELFVNSATAFPIVLKPAASYGYEGLKFPGKAKVYFIDNMAQLKKILKLLIKETSGHPDANHFVIQQRILGDDTYNFHVMCYANSEGKVAFSVSSHLLLEDHNPTAVGNPAALITESFPNLTAPAIRFLEGLNWRGFANFDIKVDPQDGKAYFFEVNPRIGRSNYYSTAAGMNPMRVFIDDLVYDRRYLVPTRQRKVLYSILPEPLVLLYTRGKLRRQVLKLVARRRTANPLSSPAEREFSLRYLRRWFYVTASTWKHILKYHRYFPLSKARELGGGDYVPNSDLGKES